MVEPPVAIQALSSPSVVMQVPLAANEASPGNAGGMFEEMQDEPTRNVDLNSPAFQQGGGLPPEVKDFLSRAHQQMVEIAKAFLTEVRLLILDEPTASLTDAEAAKLFGLIARRKNHGNHGSVARRHRGNLGEPRQPSHPDAGSNTLNYPEGSDRAEHRNPKNVQS